MLNVFIDTNIFLNFYSLSEKSIEELSKLIKLIEDEDFIDLSQIADEIIKSLEKPSHTRLSMIFEKEKDRLIPLLEILESKFFDIFRSSQSEGDMLKIKAVEDALTAKKKNVNTGLICDNLAYTLAKGGNKWQR